MYSGEKNRFRVKHEHMMHVTIIPEKFKITRSVAQCRTVFLTNCLLNKQNICGMRKVSAPLDLSQHYSSEHHGMRHNLRAFLIAAKRNAAARVRRVRSRTIKSSPRSVYVLLR